MSEHHGLASLFHSLSPDAQAAALVYGVVDPHVRTTWQVAQILRHADIQSRGRRLGFHSVRQRPPIAAATGMDAPTAASARRAAPSIT